ncbi:MAG: hypothetical protein NW217_08425 [Hyphomicrobiaceae bacterium]|nr:hypothetical protein [Hyphomicrobiaceae bacterium]
MSARLQVFIGPSTVLAGFSRIAPDTRPLTLPLIPGGVVQSRLFARLGLVPLTEDLQDRLHDTNGTGEWLDGPIDLTTTDLAFAARLSVGAALAYVEIEPSPGKPDSPAAQAAVLWAAGSVRLGPTYLAGAQALARARPMWPINTVLKALGVEAHAPLDEAGCLGLYAFPDTAALLASR